MFKCAVQAAHFFVEMCVAGWRFRATFWKRKLYLPPLLLSYSATVAVVR
jgi:hypothetical protein